MPDLKRIVVVNSPEISLKKNLYKLRKNNNRKMDSLSLEERLDAALEEADGWNKESLERVRKVIRTTKKHVPYRFFEAIEDFELYYILHPEWYDKSTHEMRSIKGGNGFYIALRLFAEKTTTNKKMRKEIIKKFFRQRYVYRHSFASVDDWISEKEKLGYNRMSSSQVQKRDMPFYNASLRWCFSHSSTTEERRALLRQIYSA